MKTSFETLVCYESCGTTRPFSLPITTDSGWRQFRFTIGAPDAEAKFKAAVAEAQQTDINARMYPSLYVRFFLLRCDLSKFKDYNSGYRPFMVLRLRTGIP